MKKIAFFDFDGTITTRDSLIEFIRFVQGDFRFAIGFMLLSPVLVGMKLGFLSNTRAKVITLRYFFGQMPVDQFNDHCRKFAWEKIPALIRPGALAEIRNHLHEGNTVFIVSASPENYLSPWCSDMGISWLCTRLETRNERITGNLDGLNCHGQEKVRRIQAGINLGEYKEIFAYGDTPADLPMLELATRAHYKPFRD